MAMMVSLMAMCRTMAEGHVIRMMMIEELWTFRPADADGLEPVLGELDRRLSWMLETAPESIDDLWKVWIDRRVRDDDPDSERRMHHLADERARRKKEWFPAAPSLVS